MNNNKNNTGYGNSGYRNSGNWNSGYGNSGDGNSGYRNSGNWNSGYGNSGDGNSGDRNSGYGNSGNWNSGNWNSGYGNSANRSGGIFCTEAPTVFCFNKPTDKKWDEIDHPTFSKFCLNKWILESEMTDEEKKAQPNFHEAGGYLKTFSWKEAWSNYWRDSSKEEKAKVLALPNFNAEIFKEITGIDIGGKTCEGKVIEFEGVKYKLTLA